MSWREKVAERERRQAVGNRDLPPRLRDTYRQSNAGIGMVPVLMGIMLGSAWVAAELDGESAIAAMLAGMALAAACFAWYVMRAHRSRSHGELRTPREPDRIEWEEP